jgi:hypothetical protein
MFLDSKKLNLFCHCVFWRLSSDEEFHASEISSYRRFWGKGVDTVERAFCADVDYGQIVKSYDAESIGPSRYATAVQIA